MPALTADEHERVEVQVDDRHDLVGLRRRSPLLPEAR